MNPKYLRNPKTGHHFPWSQLLADRGDLVPYDPEEELKSKEIRIKIPPRNKKPPWRKILREKVVEDADVC